MRDLAVRHRRRAVRGGGRDQACEGVNPPPAAPSASTPRLAPIREKAAHFVFGRPAGARYRNRFFGTFS